MENRISELRKLKGVSQGALAEALQVSRQTVISLEKNKYDPSLPLAFRISRYFGKSIEEIFIFDPA
ncbi:helix-turn-helix transcriptional regulator [Dermatophilus congolensis]|uniref:Transcriptional regulator, y4mF family n=1 Tax=Dermatophilus congolensis TaxID=1863 RepID=A0A239VNT3_9MICO|nr:helix-turn-helix transcriptional regulator [Dermatophilus congolensis]MBO3129587.1 helix-turn-helix transcriptional regulator [Dermatophilus congolensis]MBO3131780.1 helix-turn-helix transcriptional regulator [Dermatophilus congolensis]MBO3134062.1 helix-turn-helix transcriptional regulator [Dermatophilus congolensis]MBO3136295.1 helix-turn-helix transcriptional regulator [Dermatophilus congolensis]MBO3138543.1 helix-turn-helix transcriptional regulator [Dermatophilus congolensis]